MPREDEVLPAINESAGGQILDLHTLDGLGVEIPIEAGQGLDFGEVSLADAACGAALAAQAGLIGDEAVQELQVGAAVLGSLGQSSVQVRGHQGNAEHREVGQNAFTQVLPWRRRRRRGRLG